MNHCGFITEPFCSDVCGDHRRPQTLAEICRNIGICCGFRAAAAREKYPGFVLLATCKWKACNPVYIFLLPWTIGPMNMSMPVEGYGFRVLGFLRNMTQTRSFDGKPAKLHYHATILSAYHHISPGVRGSGSGNVMTAQRVIVHDPRPYANCTSSETVCHLTWFGFGKKFTRGPFY